MKRIWVDDTYKRKKHFEWFNSFENPSYSINVRLDVTNIVQHSKMQNRSFFIDFLYVVTEALHSIPEMRMRIKDDEIILYDTINPSYTIMTDEGVFDTCRHVMSHDYMEFYQRAETAIEYGKHNYTSNGEFNNTDIVDDFYISSLPWIDTLSMTNPMPTGDKNNLSIPRILWSKYVQNNNKYELTFNITVNHALVDGKHISDAVLAIQKLIENVNPYSDVIEGDIIL